jgi:uncharacterized membrane protein YvlD (DUF360 family)
LPKEKFLKPTRAVSLRLVGRFIIIWIIETVAVLWLATRFPGLELGSPRSPAIILSAIGVALTISVVNMLTQPFLIILRLPLNVVSIIFSSIIVNGIILRLAAVLLPGFDIEPIVPNELVAALLIALINTVLISLIALDDEYAFFQFAMHVLAHKRNLRSALHPPTGKPGIVIVQIDGLSSQRLHYAVDSGLMPTLKELIQSGSHCVTTFDCGLPSQTSACQAGIMYGVNTNIPAFRWYDKRTHKMVVSNHMSDTNMIDNMVSTGKGLLRGGSSINNMLNGDASKTLLTLSTFTGHTNVPTARAIEDFSSFWFNPYTFIRTLFSTIGDLLIEVMEAARQFIRREWPRMDRLFNGQVFLRVLTNVFLRDLSVYVAILDISRGVPIIYTTYIGYDQVAHHAGPDSQDALNVLRGMDKQLRHIVQATRHLAPHPYQLYVLSDHGQSFGATFRQRYKHTLRDLVDRLTSQSTSVIEALANGDKVTYTTALIQELDAAGKQLAEQPNMRFRRAVMRSTARTLERTQTPQSNNKANPGQIIICASGNLAHIYFDLGEGKLSLSEIEQVHPLLVQGLVEHEGVGCVGGYTDEGEVIVLGKKGARNLSTGAITGEDPLLPFGNPEIRAAQLLRIAEFPNAGDLILNSTLYSDGTVASFEDLIGVHGGMGGQQMDAFIVSPAQANLSGEGIINATQVYALLERQREAGLGRSGEESE